MKALLGVELALLSVQDDSSGPRMHKTRQSIFMCRDLALSIQPLLREPLLDQARDLQVVPVHHQHVRVAAEMPFTTPARFVPFGPLFPELQPECCLLLRRFLRYRPAVAPYTTGIATNRTRLMTGAMVETATPRSASIGETAVRTAT